MNTEVSKPAVAVTVPVAGSAVWRMSWNVNWSPSSASVTSSAASRAVRWFACGRLSAGFSLHCTRGKLADSEDSFLFCYRKIRPDKENFILSARFTVTGTEEKAAAWQAGYGIFALDTAESGSLASRHRNMMAVGRFRMREPRICESGVRLVDGYTRADACGYDEKRTLDSSRTASFLK